MAIKQYPHYLFVLQSEEASQDEDGNWIGGSEPTPVFHSKCREEVNASGRRLEVAGGSYHVFKSVIQMPKNKGRIAEGSQIVITDDDAGDNVRLEGSVLKFDKAQLHSRLWV